MDEAAQALARTSQSEFPVVDDNDRPVGLLGRGDIVNALKEQGPQAHVADVMSTNLPTASYRGRLEDAFRLLQEQSAHAVGVLDVNGRLAGLVTPETIGHTPMLRKTRPEGASWGPWCCVRRDRDGIALLRLGSAGNFASQQTR